MCLKKKSNFLSGSYPASQSQSRSFEIVVAVAVAVVLQICGFMEILSIFSTCSYSAGDHVLLGRKVQARKNAQKWVTSALLQYFFVQVLQYIS